MHNVAIFGSVPGPATLSRALLAAIEHGELSMRIAAIVATNNQAGVFAVAQEFAIPCLVMPSHKGDGEQRIKDFLDEEQIELIALAGYIKKIGPLLLDAFPNLIL